jgi:hypothetical protein|tara:strand:- start:515 stop:1129 length:615 start_codon:yes stop_codon:yes gene_type:complete
MSLIIKSSYEDFIGIYQTRYDCSTIIDFFHYCENNNVGLKPRDEFKPDGKSSNNVHHAKDARIELSYNSKIFNLPPFEAVTKSLNQCLGECLDLYMEQYEILRCFELQNTSTLVQKTRPGEGYHVWHSEDGMPANMHRRKLTWMIYLNDIKDGGETEFLYYGKRIQPKKGTILIWPVNFTHAHRGNPPLKEDKYVATGWLESKY